MAKAEYVQSILLSNHDQDDVEASKQEWVSEAQGE